jgi:putative glutamine amidotransferase
MQLINVECGGTLYQDLPDQRPSRVAHAQQFDRRRPAHVVTLMSGSTLARAFGQPQVRVNTTHHQAVKDLGTGMVAVGHAEDGLVEAVEVSGGAFCVGVQWHPELLASTEEDPHPCAVYRAFIEAARARKQSG